MAIGILIGIVVGYFTINWIVPTIDVCFSYVNAKISIKVNEAMLVNQELSIKSQKMAQESECDNIGAIGFEIPSLDEEYEDDCCEDKVNNNFKIGFQG